MIDAETYELALQEGYREEARCYAQALQIAERITVELKQGSRTEESLAQLHDVFGRIAAVESRLAALPRPEGGGDAGPRAKAAKAEVIALLERVVTVIREGEREAVARRDLLIVPLEMGIRARRMQRAYGQRR